MTKWKKPAATDGLNFKRMGPLKGRFASKVAMKPTSPPSRGVLLQQPVRSGLRLAFDYPPYHADRHRMGAPPREEEFMSVIKVIFAAATVIATAAPAATQDWPTRPVTLVVPFAAGGPMDTVGRILALRISENLRQQVVVENVGGAGGMTGSARVAKAAPDGYQFLLGNLGTHAASQTFYKNPLYNAVTDFAPVALIAEIPFVLVARKDFPASNLPEFIAHARTNHATMQFGSGGSGSATHLACVLLNTAIGVNVTHVPY